MSRQLITEWLPFVVDKAIVQESVSGRPLIVRGILQRADSENKNGRVYPKPILEREVAKYAKDFVKNKRAFGELDHPESPIVTLANVSHNILEIGWDGDDVVGVIEILDTPAGRILETFFKRGYSVGISSRGMGSVRDLGEGVVEVEDDYEVVAWDFVSNPSTHRAFMVPKEKHMTESYKPGSEFKYAISNSILSDIFCNIGGVCKLEKNEKN
jgi:hypothetical protein